MLTALYHTLGCKLNFAETSTIATLLRERGVARVGEGETPDIIVVNTCSVTALADKKCRQTVRSLARRYPDAAILLTGCYAQLNPEEAATLPGVAVVAGNDRKDRLGAYLDRFLETRLQAVEVTPASAIRLFTPSCSAGDRTRYFLKVQDGCDYWCSYCTIPRARGRSRSPLIADLVQQARAAAEGGAREVVLAGVNIGDFGRANGETFRDLCHALQQVAGIERYRISSIEPNLLTPELVADIADGTLSRFMPHFHIPLQSGDDEVLRLMRRRYDTALFAERIDLIRRLLPDAFIGVDLIVGMRGETEERFEKSKRYVESLDISRLHVFTYSERPDTAALDILPVVSQEEKHRRTQQMLAVSETKLRHFAARYAGSVRPVLLEHRQSDGTIAGYTDNYLRVTLPAGTLTENSIVDVTIGDTLVGEEIPSHIAP